ncbi:MAG: ATP-binding protein [Candidatus Vogelbacteria bacterium]|nr:ATP-binding protein [Candidatus Vogelbacteria bacterium]
MPLPSLEVIKEWKIADLRNWLTDPGTQEGWDYDFKLDLPDSRNDKEKSSVRSCYCSFANSRDGIIFYGIDDNKQIQGLGYDHNFKNRVSHILSSDVFPQIKEWDLFHVIYTTTRKRKCVYLVLVKESFYSDKPHVTDGRIWVRENGHRDYIKTGVDIQRHFLLPDKLFPKYTNIIIFILENIIKNYQGHIPFFDSLVLARFKHFLQESCANDLRRDVFIPILNNIVELEGRMPVLSDGYAKMMNVQGSAWEAKKNEADDIAQQLIDALRRAS